MASRLEVEMNAKDYFEDCRSQVRKVAQSEERYRELTESDIGAIKYDEVHTSSHDPMARIDAAMDYLQVIEKRKADLAEILEYATSVLYGIDGHVGLAKLKGSVYADAICMHYLDDMTWKAIAEQAVIYSSKQLRNYAMAGFSAIDRYGFAYLREGHDDSARVR